MTDLMRRELLDVLGELSSVCPDWRFGQMVANLATVARDPSPESIWDVEDHELLTAARHHLQYFRDRAANLTPMEVE